MARIDILREIYCKKMLIKDFDFDALFHVPISHYLTQADVVRLHYLATSAKWSSKSKKEKFAEIDKVMVPRGFKWFHTGTNRIVYKNEYDHSFLLKIAFDATAINDNPDEMFNQGFVKPFVTKIFDVTPCGTVGMVERVQPIGNRYEFEDIAGQIFDILHNFFIGKYILEDIGTDFFKNWGIRDGFGPVLLDFPYLFETDGDKLQCSAIFPNGTHCHGTIDYDSGLNTLVCEECGKRYSARSLSKANHIKSVKYKIIKEEYNMEKEILVSIVKDGKEFKLYSESDYIAPNIQKPKQRMGKEEDLSACVVGGYNKNEVPKQQEIANRILEDITKHNQVKVEDSPKQEPEVWKRYDRDTTSDVVTESQIVKSPDMLEEEFEEVPSKHFKSSNENSVLENQDEKTEHDFASETLKEQLELEKSESQAADVAGKMLAKDRVLMNEFMLEQMTRFPFDKYTDSTQQQRSDIVDFLVTAVSAKYTIDPEIAVMSVVEFTDSQYEFNHIDEETAKAEALAEKYFGGASYRDEDTFVPIKRNTIAREF
jgi:hypothetical protein